MRGKLFSKPRISVSRGQFLLCKRSLRVGVTRQLLEVVMNRHAMAHVEGEESTNIGASNGNDNGDRQL